MSFLDVEPNAWRQAMEQRARKAGARPPGSTSVDTLGCPEEGGMEPHGGNGLFDNADEQEQLTPTP